MIGPLLALALGAHAVTAVADGVPRLDTDKLCHSVKKAGKDDPAADACLRSEREARDALDKRWSEFPAAAKDQCSREMRIGGDFPSYVELLTCLELAGGAFKGPSGQGGPMPEPNPPAAPASPRAELGTPRSVTAVRLADLARAPSGLVRQQH